MDEVISLSSEDSDVEVIGCYSNKPDPPPLSDVKVVVDAVDVKMPQPFIDLTDPRWTLPELKLRKRQISTPFTLIDLTESKISDETKQETMHFPSSDSKMKVSNNDEISKRDNFNKSLSSFTDSALHAPQQDCGEVRCVNSQTQLKRQNDESHPDHHTPAVKLRRLSETHVDDLKMSNCSMQVTEESTQMSLCLGQLGINRDPPECITNLRTTTDSLADSLLRQEQEENNGFTSSQLNDLPHSPSPPSPTTTLKSSEIFNFLSHSGPASHDLNCKADIVSSSEHKPAENMTELQSDKAKTQSAPNSPVMYYNLPSEPALSVCKTEGMDEGSGDESHRGYAGMDSPLSFGWQEGSDVEEVNEESRFDVEFRAASREDRRNVCPVMLRKIMSGPGQALIDGEDEGFGTPEVLCRQSLSLVYSTIDENYPEGTLQLLSDLLQPGFYPPKDITTHLVHNILLDPQCPHHLCVQAFNLLMRTQRHHMVDKSTVPWDWELLTSVMANQDCTKRCRCEVVRMLLEYIVQTLEDDFHAKHSASALHHSIAKATLSCDHQFPRVRDIIKWLFSAIIRSTDQTETARERDEQIRIVSIFQRMLSLSLEVDRSPALTSVKLSQELFHMVISNVSVRAHRMLLLESLQSKLLRCKLLEHLLDYACPVKIALPMSLSLLLHFMKNCTLTPDPMDGSDRWHRWEELVHLLWMLLLSYNKAMEGYLCSSGTEQRNRVAMLVYKPDDKVSKDAIRDAAEAFLSRSQADLGQALPLHVEESLTYLQDHLLDVCQC